MTEQPDNAAQSAGAGTGTSVESRPAPPKADLLPRWKVLLHNDDVNETVYVVDSIVELTTLNRKEATLRMLQAHHLGIALLLSTHKEHAELLQEQFTSKQLTVTIEPDD